jgi:multidrug efflux pump subunit AcrA (membrane-fusion protein)
VNEETVAPARRSKRPIAITIGLIMVVVIILGLWLASRPAPEQLQGMVDADEVNVGTKALARVERLIAEEGQRVQPGTLLATLSSPEIAGGQAQAQGTRGRIGNQRGRSAGGHRDAALDMAGRPGGCGFGSGHEPAHLQPVRARGCGSPAQG